MNKTKKLSGIYLFILFLATAVPTVLRTVALLQNFDYRSGYFSDGKTLITAAGITVSALVLLLLTFAFTAQMPTKLRASFNTPATYIPVGAVGAALIFFAADAYVALRAFDMPILLLIKMKDSAAITSLSLTVLSISACVFFIANALITEKSSATRAFFGICTVLFLLFYFAFLYFDKTLPINAPNKIVDQLAYISAAGFFLFETRISLDREYWRSYVAFGFAATALTAYSAIPSVLIYFTNGEIISNSIFETALTLTLFIFILSRTVLALNLPEDAENRLVSLMKRFGDERNAELEEKHAIEKRAYIEMLNRLEEVKELPEEPEEPTPATEEANGTAATDDEQISIFDDRDTPSNDEPTESTAPTEEAPEEPKSNRTEATDAPEAEKSDEVKDEEQVSIFDDTEEGKSE